MFLPSSSSISVVSELPSTKVPYCLRYPCAPPRLGRPFWSRVDENLQTIIVRKSVLSLNAGTRSTFYLFTWSCMRFLTVTIMSLTVVIAFIVREYTAVHVIASDGKQMCTMFISLHGYFVSDKLMNEYFHHDEQ